MVVATMMAKEPTRRYATAAAVAEALAPYCHVDVSPRRSRRWPIVAIAIDLAFVALIVF